MPVPVTSNISLLKKGLLSSKLAANSTPNDLVLDLPCLDQFEWSARITEAEETFSQKNASTSPINATVTRSDNPTRVRMLLDNGDDNEIWPYFRSEQSSPQALYEKASLQDVSKFFHLNRKQHKIFVRAGSRLLQSIVEEDSDNVEHMIGFLTGLPGSGKSCVIKALQGLAKAWKCQDAIETVAHQGVEAKAANGQTIHKLFQWSVNSNCYTKRYSLEQKERFAPLKMLILDEASTADVKLIGMIDHALRELKNKPNAVFGGIHILFVGDWLQQLPVAGVPAFVSDQEKTPTSTLQLILQGFEVLKRIVKSTKLSFSMRV